MHSSKASKPHSGHIGPLRSPQASYLVGKSHNLNPAIGANTTVPGTAPKAAPIRSPLTPMKGGKKV